ncbi:phage shock protein C, PspC [Emticicia oligotrophica DSM 17448]|uniref:Phage shock protein C, PspC n=1 Tax=Emticicia oligotrophica (strain DSM 17448 / CIP 109782 / MTCC 6937 / GPTSA100-15) TaxID=929562 RepID=A0ABN4AIX6_EMTOG|nr:PspC domain-containing protein [Emticicia oligotrophica]AFK01990.1 phage shock protein C, PspC [Emticicia oligotrophica DSM 17448]
MVKKLYRTEGSEKMVFGVCGGIAKYIGVDAALIRILWAILTIFGIGTPILIYIIMTFIIPRESQMKA